jgi:hypothetical protein
MRPVDGIPTDCPQASDCGQEGSERFFLKKEQKRLFVWHRRRQETREAKRTKVFGSFCLQKRAACLHVY